MGAGGRGGAPAGTPSVGEVPGDDGLAADGGDADAHASGIRVEDVGDVVPLAGIRLGHECAMAPVQRGLLAHADVVALVFARPSEAHAATGEPRLARAAVQPVMAEVVVASLIPR